MRYSLILLMVLAFVVGACGGDDTGDLPATSSTTLPLTTTATVAPTTTTTPTTTRPAPTTTTATIAPPPPGSLTIMAIGDSITHGQAGTASYRCYLDGMLREAGVSFDFVGSQAEPYSGSEYGCTAAFDEDHEAYAGGTIGVVGIIAMPSVKDLQPDVALVLLGGVDIIWRGRDPADSASALESLITDMQLVKPDITILVAQITPCATEQPIADYAARCAAEDIGPVFNDAIASFTSLSTDESEVIVVDLNTGFSLDYLRDGWHPTDAGDQLIACRWMKALEDAGLI